MLHRCGTDSHPKICTRLLQRCILSGEGAVSWQKVNKTPTQLQQTKPIQQRCNIKHFTAVESWSMLRRRVLRSCTGARFLDVHTYIWKLSTRVHLST